MPAAALQMEQLQSDLLAAGQALGAGVQLLLLLTKFRFGLAAEDFEVLRCSLSPAVVEGAEVRPELTSLLQCFVDDVCFRLAVEGFECAALHLEPSSSVGSRGETQSFLKLVAAEGLCSSTAAL
jgi:hypothetical protein